MNITDKNAVEFATTGRKGWKIENEGFNMQKNYRYDITRSDSRHTVIALLKRNQKIKKYIF